MIHQLSSEVTGSSETREVILLQARPGRQQSLDIRCLCSELEHLVLFEKHLTRFLVKVPQVLGMVSGD